MAKLKNIKISIEHLRRLTDGTGIIQHSKYIIPDRQTGYCTDDNARALIVAAKYRLPQLFEIYLAFLHHAIKPDKTVHNFLSYNRKWQDGEPQHDAIGRTIWAFGSAISSTPNNDYIPVIKEFFLDTCNHIPSMPIRGTAYAIFGLAEFLEKFPQDKRAIALLTSAANSLVEKFSKYSSAQWEWFEDILSYANAIMPAALYAAAKILNDKTYLNIAEKTCSFLLANTFNGKFFSFIGSNGWYPKGKTRAAFDQQPIEAGDTVIMLAHAYKATKNKKYRNLQKKAFNWFLGENDIDTPLYDKNTGGCRDGLGQDGVNINQGAESILSFLLAELNLIK